MPATRCVMAQSWVRTGSGSIRGKASLVRWEVPGFAARGVGETLTADQALSGLRRQDTLTSIRNATNKGWALGNKQFRDEIAASLGRRTQPISCGERNATIQLDSDPEH